MELRNCSSRTVPNAATWCGGSGGCRPGSAEITSPGRRRIERAVVLVVLNFLRLGQQVAVALRVLRRPLYVAGESRMASIDGYQLNVMTSARSSSRSRTAISAPRLPGVAR